MKSKFILAETDRPVSFDPLSADYSNNLHASQMLHRAILDVGPDNALRSSVLKTFSYDPQEGRIEFEVSEQAVFSDGSPIKAQDVAWTVARMAVKRPQFPVLRHIEGLSDWIAQPHPLETLPKGIEIRGNSVRILLTRNVNTPLFRFALPLFGVIKSDCLNRQTNEMKADCPTSGFYRLKDHNESQYHFVLTDLSLAKYPGLAKQITLAYFADSLKESDLKALGQDSTVIQLMDHRREQSIGDQNGFSRIEQPNSRFSVFLLNPDSEIFQKPACRRAFAERLRSNIDQTQTQAEASLFSRILPGYLSSTQLAAVPLSENDIRECEKHFRGKSVRWMRNSSDAVRDFEEALIKTAKQLDIRLELLGETSPRERYEAFDRGEVQITLGGSGFWAFDPVGDVQMLLTPNLHKPLKFVARDAHLKKLLEGLEFEADPNQRLEQINRYVYEQALMNVYAHSKRVYLVRNVQGAASIPVAITPPAPWQIFDGREN